MGFWRIEKTAELPPADLLARLELRPLDYSRYKRVHDGQANR
jgi:hypothetical protein